MVEKTFTTAELARYDGKDGEAAYIAFEGKVYDVTDSPMWESGTHEFEHEAGEDLTDAMVDATHGADVMDGFPVVGILAD
jgi:predicted heme/steroid binding protein